jgi:hypothetical protein
METEVKRIIIKKENKSWVEEVLKIMKYYPTMIEYLQKGTNFTTMNIMQKNNQGEMLYILYVYRRKGLVVTSTPLSLINQIRTKFPSNQGKFRTRWFDKTVSAISAHK